MTRIETIPVAGVVFNKEYYTRFETQDPKKVQEYAKSIVGGAFPPIILTHEYVLLDGWHRWMAHKACALETIDAEIMNTEGMDIHEIRRKAARFNFRHGIPQSDNELRRMVRDEYRAKMEQLDQAGREALKAAMVADFGRSSSYIREVTSRIDKDYKAELRQIAFEMWMACYTHSEIAERIGYARQPVDEYVEKLQDAVNASRGVSGISSENQSLDYDDDETDTNSLGVYKLDQRLLVKANHIDEKYKRPLYNVWKQQDRSEQVSHFGNSEVTWLDHLLCLYTNPFDIVIDPFGGGGSTIDLCKTRLRRYLVSDRKPVEIRDDIRAHDITEGVLAPPQWKDVRLIYLDPPYWKQSEGQYSDDPTDLANMELGQFNDTLSGLIKQYAEKLKRSNSGTSHIALILQPTQWNAPDHQYTDHVADMLKAVKLPIDMRISAPYESQQCNAQMVEWAKANRKLLVLSREIVVWKIA